jgi:carbonic anhydrase
MMMMSRRLCLRLPHKKRTVSRNLILEKLLARMFFSTFLWFQQILIHYSIEESIREDVAILKASPLIRKDTQIVGVKYDIDTGILSQVEDDKSEL